MINHVIFNKEISIWNVISFIRIYYRISDNAEEMCRTGHLVSGYRAQMWWRRWWRLFVCHSSGRCVSFFSLCGKYHHKAINVNSWAKGIWNLKFVLCVRVLFGSLPVSFQVGRETGSRPFNGPFFIFAIFVIGLKPFKNKGSTLRWMVAAALHVRMQVTPTQLRAYVISQWLDSLFICSSCYISRTRDLFLFWGLEKWLFSTWAELLVLFTLSQQQYSGG